LTTNIQNIIADFSPISLQEMDSVKLLNRTDTKFVMTISQFEKLLPELNSDYTALEIKEKRSANYKTVYFDSPEYQYYLDHHNKRPNRYKVRMRSYVDSGLCFFEIKHKYKGRTLKQRIKIDDFKLNFDHMTNKHLESVIENAPELKPSIWNEFERITMVNNDRKERLTFDIGLNFSWEGKNFGYDQIIIAEVKQEANDRMAPCIQVFKANGIRQERISKYCIGMGILYPNLKSNNFKSKFLTLNKLQDNVGIHF
jgi:hypothetical protein